MTPSRHARKIGSALGHTLTGRVVRVALIIICLPMVAYGQQASPPVQTLAAMVQECTAREASARVGAAMLQADITSLRLVNEDLRKQLKVAQDNANHQ